MTQIVAEQTGKKQIDLHLGHGIIEDRDKSLEPWLLFST